MLHNVSCNFAILLYVCVIILRNMWKNIYHLSLIIYVPLRSCEFFISNSLREKEEEANKFVKMYGLIFFNISLQMAHLFI